MKTKLLLLAGLCAVQYGLTMFAAEERQPIDNLLQNLADSQNANAAPKQVTADDNIVLYQKGAATFALLQHNRCGATSLWYGLPGHILQQICECWKKSISYPFQQTALAFAGLTHRRLGSQSPFWLPAYDVKRIGIYLKEACKLRCSFKDCNFGTFDTDAMAAHLDEHAAAPAGYSHNHSLTREQMQQYYASLGYRSYLNVSKIDLS